MGTVCTTGTSFYASSFGHLDTLSFDALGSHTPRKREPS